MLSKVLTGSSEDTPMLAVGLMLLALTMLSVQDAMVKLISADTSLWQFQTLRAVLNLLFVGAIVFVARKEVSLRARRPVAILVRSLFHLSALSFFFAGAPFLSLAEMAGGLYTFPLFVVVLSVLVLRERVGVWRLMGVGAGFVGTLLVLRPGSESFHAAAVLPVIAGFSYGCFVITTRRWCRGESPLVLVLGSNLTIVTVGACGWLMLLLWQPGQQSRLDYPFLLDVQQDMTLWVGLVILACAFLNTTANLFLGKAYQSADSSFLAPVDYLYLVFAAFWGWVFWSDVPDSRTTLGLMFIAAGGTFVAWRERVVRRRTANAPTS